MTTERVRFFPDLDALQIFDRGASGHTAPPHSNGQRSLPPTCLEHPFHPARRQDHDEVNTNRGPVLTFASSL